MQETTMRFIRLTIASAAIAVAVGAAVFTGVAHAQSAKATIDDPVGPPPDPSHIPIVLPKDIKWTGQEGRNQQAVLFGDASKPGLYGVVIKWYPGNFSQPHSHDQERYAYVISGTWWVSTSNVYDEKTTYPVKAGTVAIDKANTVHWDGARLGEKEPAVLVLVGMGPVKTVQVDENGKPKAPAPRP
jgi:quercetin dioxygenase-like cupin family protein